MLIALLIRISGGQPNADRVLDTLVVRTVMPLVALIVGTAAIGSEIEDGTAVYLMIKPIPRWQIALSKGLVAAGLTAALVVPAVVLTGFLLGGGRRHDDRRSSASRSPAWSAEARMPWRSWRSASSPRVRSCSVSAYTLIWEGVLSGLLEGTKFLSIRQATLGLAAALGVDVPGDPLVPVVSVAVLAVVLVGGFLLASWKLARFEIRGGD